MKAYEFNPKILLEDVLNEFEKSKEELLSMVHTLQGIINTSDHEGEKENARVVLARILGKLRSEHGWEPKTKQNPPKQNNTKAKYGKQAGAYQKTQTSRDTAFKIVYVGRYLDPTAGQRGSDKVWGWGVKEDKLYYFWGATGRSPRVKILNNTPFNRAEAQDKAKQKARKGYKAMSAKDNQEWLARVLQTARQQQSV